MKRLTTSNSILTIQLLQFTAPREILQTKPMFTLNLIQNLTLKCNFFMTLVQSKLSFAIQTLHEDVCRAHQQTSEMPRALGEGEKTYN